MIFENIRYEEKACVAWITFNRPEIFNAIDESGIGEFTRALIDANDNDEIQIIVITGAGEKAFSAGGNINVFLDSSPQDTIKKRGGQKGVCELIREIPKPTIAMVNGLALGGGFEIAMACDIVIASENARFGLPEINVGLIPGSGGTQILPRLIGEKKAKELIFTGRKISAEEALNLGLINAVVSKSVLHEEVDSFISELKSKSPAILKIAKLSINKSLETPLTVGLACETDYLAMCFGTEDQKEGARAFLEKRKPLYKGR